MTIDPALYDAYECVTPDGEVQICTACTEDEIRAAAKLQCEEGHAMVVYGPTGGNSWAGRAKVLPSGCIELREYRNGVWKEVAA